MKSTGIARKVDSLGRIVLPKELRVARDISVDTLMEIFVREDEIVLKKFEPYNKCAVTGEVSQHNISLLHGQLSLSPESVKKLVKELECLLIRH
ncbi:MULTISPECIES: AbrB/MazE/SpoVT family DNA-binding domain-containing protein [Priestia]|uniref:AbrB/MazE/SpoVT family DNA-binding domain-containing protein n=1 Tax=Priestia TaxID=2800373 RepID=UPI00189DF178|nr:AbrB/MazE/SpoVT family DNA-binding domain-containing protein [Priestia megaterium]